MPARPSPFDLFNPFPDRLRYIAVEGVIGAGKTTFARAIARAAGARLVLEEFEENAFLPRFYEDPDRWAFPTQLAFLASRFRQQKALATRDLFQQAVVSDYTFDKDRLFAHVTLTGDELQLYESLFSIMEANAPVPDLLIYLRSSVDRLMRNIGMRARSYEAGMDPAYLKELAESYDRHFTHYRKGAILIVNSTDLDFVARPDHLDALLRAVVTAGPGSTIFSPPVETQGRLV